MLSILNIKDQVFDMISNYPIIKKYNFMANLLSRSFDIEILSYICCLVRKILFLLPYYFNQNLNNYQQIKFQGLPTPERNYFHYNSMLEYFIIKKLKPRRNILLINIRQIYILNIFTLLILLNFRRLGNSNSSIFYVYYLDLYNKVNFII